MPAKQKQWAMFYEVNGKTYGIITHLGCLMLSEDSVNLFSNKKLFDQYYTRAVRIPRAIKQNKHYDTFLKVQYRNGRVFVARFGSKNFPVKLTAEPRFQSEGWALRVPFKIK